MLNSWQKVYSALKDLIAEHSEVEIETNRVRLPSSIRPEFYRLFDLVGTAFVEEKSPALLSESQVLGESYMKVEREAIKLLGLESVSASPSLHRFLHNPIDQLIKGLFDPVFDLLKAKVGIETFEERASRNIEASFGPLYGLGYEKWVVLSLVKLLEADKSFQVIINDLSPYDLIKEGGFAQVPFPTPEESKSILFKYEPTAALMVPDFIVYSAKVNRYIAFRSEIGKALTTVSNIGDKREWYPLNSVVALKPGLTLIYIAGDPEEISLVADVKRICRPDLVIECRVQKDWYEKGGLHRIKLYHDSLKPRLGAYIVSREPVPEQAYKELMPEQVSKEPISEQESKKQDAGIRILTVGFDQSKLEPIISILAKTDNKRL